MWLVTYTDGTLDADGLCTAAILGRGTTRQGAMQNALSMHNAFVRGVDPACEEQDFASMVQHFDGCGWQLSILEVV